MSSSKILLHNTKWIYLSKLATQIIGLFTTVMIVSKLDVDSFGKYSLLLASFVVFQIFSLSSITSVINRYVPEYLELHKITLLKRLVAISALIAILIFSLQFWLLYIFKVQFSAFFNIPDFDKCFFSFGIFCYAFLVQNLLDVLLKSMLLHKRVGKLIILNSMIRLFLYIIFIKSLNVDGLLLIEAVLAFIYSIQAIVVYTTYVNKLKDTNDTESTFFNKRVFRYGLWSLVNEMGVGVVGKTSDYFIVAAISSPYHLGLYSFSQKVFEVFNKLIPFKDLQTVIRPLFIKKFSSQYSVSDFNKYFKLMVKMLLPIYLIPLFYFIVLGGNTIRIVFDTKYSEAYTIIVIFLSSNLFLAYFYPLSLFAQLKERVDVMLYSKVVIVYSVVFGILGMKFYGLIGVAVVSLFGDLLKNLIIYYFLRKYQEIKFSILDIKNYFFVILIIPVLFILDSYQFGLVSYVIVSILCLMIYVILMLLFNPFTNNERRMIMKIGVHSKITKAAIRIVNNTHERFLCLIPNSLKL